MVLVKRVCSYLAQNCVIEHVLMILCLYPDFGVSCGHPYVSVIEKHVSMCALRYACWCFSYNILFLYIVVPHVFLVWNCDNICLVLTL